MAVAIHDDRDSFGLRIIKAFNGIDQSIEKFKRNQVYLQQKVKMIRKQHLASPLSEVLGTVVMVIVIYYGGSLVLGGGDLKDLMDISWSSQLIQPSKSLTELCTIFRK